jgi:hypothetical protein
VVSEVKYLNPLATPDRIPEYVHIQTVNINTRYDWNGSFQHRINWENFLGGVDFKKPVGKTTLIGLEFTCHQTSLQDHSGDSAGDTNIDAAYITYRAPGGSFQILIPQEEFQFIHTLGENGRWRPKTTHIYSMSAGALKGVVFEEGDTSVGELDLHMFCPNYWDNRRSGGWMTFGYMIRAMWV